MRMEKKTKTKCARCKEPITSKREERAAIIRVKEVCKRCFYVLKRDNLKRFRKGMSISKSFKLLPEPENPNKGRKKKDG